MDLLIRQRVDVHYCLDASSAYWSHFESRAERLQPWVGMALIAACGTCMLARSAQGAGAVVVSFLMFWGIYLVARRQLVRVFAIVRTWVRWRRSSYEETLRFFDQGYSRSDPVGTVRTSWNEIEGWFRHPLGITLLTKDRKTRFISTRSMPESALKTLESFLAARYTGHLVHAASTP